MTGNPTPIPTPVSYPQAKPARSSVRGAAERATASALGGVQRIAPQSGTAFLLRKGAVLRVIDPMGEQVSDLFALSADNHDSYLSSGRTIDYASKYLLSVGDTLYSNDSQEMLTIVTDTVKRHDFTLTPCSQRMFEKLYGWVGHHPSCFENLGVALGAYGVSPERIQSTFNIFMNVSFDNQGVVAVHCPLSRAGDFIEFRAERDLLCGLTACSAEGSNNGTLKPIDFQVFPPDAVCPAP